MALEEMVVADVERAPGHGDRGGKPRYFGWDGPLCLILEKYIKNLPPK